MAVISRSCIAVLANFLIACAWPGDGAETGEAPERCVLGAPGPRLPLVPWVPCAPGVPAGPGVVSSASSLGGA